MSFINISESLKIAEKRLLGKPSKNSGRRPRSDRGKMRISPRLAAKLNAILSEQEKPSIKKILSELTEYCNKKRAKPPARATLYQFMAKTSTGNYQPMSLPMAVQDALYNLDLNVPVPGHQLAFYCFNYGNLAAISFASVLPWLPLYQAAKMRGYREKSRGLLEAVLRVRGI